MEIKVTEGARPELDEIVASGKYPRIALQTGGCCGASRLMLYASGRRENEESYRFDGYDFLVDERAVPLLWRTKVDYKKRGFFKDFVVTVG